MNNTKEMICIVCPMGCHLSINIDNNCQVFGNACPRGEKYAKEELISPKRVITTTVRVESAIHNMAPVKTDKPIPKELIFDCMKLIKKIQIKSPMNAGDIIIKNILKTNANIILTRDI